MRIRCMLSSRPAGTTRARWKPVLVGAACLALVGGCEPAGERQRSAPGAQVGVDAAPGSSGSWDAKAQDTAIEGPPADASAGNPAADAGAAQIGSAPSGGMNGGGGRDGGAARTDAGGGGATGM